MKYIPSGVSECMAFTICQALSQTAEIPADFINIKERRKENDKKG
ncbi:hypothetical protein AALB16_08620 [Lachnospiraceae bacterium 62-35]